MALKPNGWTLSSGGGLRSVARIPCRLSQGGYLRNLEESVTLYSGNAEPCWDCIEPRASPSSSVLESTAGTLCVQTFPRVLQARSEAAWLRWCSCWRCGRAALSIPVRLREARLRAFVLCVMRKPLIWWCSVTALSLPSKFVARCLSLTSLSFRWKSWRDFLCLKQREVHQCLSYFFKYRVCFPKPKDWAPAQSNFEEALCLWTLGGQRNKTQILGRHLMWILIPSLPIPCSFTTLKGSVGGGREHTGMSE